jgi:hypothetical protein
MRKLILIGSIVISIAVLFVPLNTVVVPEWRVQLINEYGVPYQGKLVRQFCDNYTLGVSPCQDAPDAMQNTDSNGYVVFPERIISMNLGARIFRTLTNVLFAFSHGSLGTSVYLDSSGPKGYKTLSYVPGVAPPDRFILPSDGRP